MSQPDLIEELIDSSLSLPGKFIEFNGQAANENVCTRAAKEIERLRLALNAGSKLSELVHALKMARIAIGDHFAPNDCYVTGPLTGNRIADFAMCPACEFLALYEKVKDVEKIKCAHQYVIDEESLNHKCCQLCGNVEKIG